MVSEQVKIKRSMVAYCYLIVTNTRVLQDYGIGIGTALQLEGPRLTTPINPDFGKCGFQGDYKPSTQQSTWCVNLF